MSALNGCSLAERLGLSTGERIAVVDDEDAMTTVTAALLRRWGYDAVAFNSAPCFLKDFDRRPERMSLVIADVVMPGMSGIELVRRVRESGHELPILLMTGFNFQVRLECGGNLGRLAFLRKPFTSHQLEQSVRRLLGGHSQNP